MTDDARKGAGRFLAYRQASLHPRKFLYLQSLIPQNFQMRRVESPHKFQDAENKVL